MHRAQEAQRVHFIYEIVLTRSTKNGCARRPTGGFCLKWLTNEPSLNSVGYSPYAITQIHKSTTELLCLLRRETAFAAIAVDAVHLMVEPR